MYRVVLVLAVFVLVIGCKESKEHQEQGVESMIDESEYARQRKEVLKSIARGPLSVVDDKAALVGRWEVHLRDPISPDKIWVIYAINSDGTLTITHVEQDAPEEEWTWQLNDDDTLSFFYKVAPDPTVLGLEEGAGGEERYLLFSLDKNCLILSNDDTSIVQVLNRIE